ncbi:MAG: 30S ribosomal protein S6 [Patescibacteria group bacterium]
MMTAYELLYIIPATFTDEDVGRIEANVKALLEKHGATVDSMTRLGKFRFAYPIKNVRHGHYVMVRFTSEGASLAKIEGELRISPEVLRHLTLKASEAGGEKFDLVQFTEVNIDNKEDERPRRRREGEERKADIKSGVAVLEGKTEEAAAEKKDEPAKEISAEELDKKIDTALTETP